MIALCFLRYTVPNNGAAFFENDMSGNGDDNLDPERAQDPQGSLERQNERLQLLLNLTTRITSNLDLREVLRAISANFREVMRCDGAGVWLPGEEAGTFKLYAFDSPVSKGFAREELIITPAENDPGKRAFETMKPMVATVEEIGWPGGGEAGTGKELIARAIHDRSRRKERTLVKLNCAAIPTGLLESELFGHEKGAFTGAVSQKIGRMELADQGTLFLDEVGDIPTDIQPKLLRALQEREFERLGSAHTRRVNFRLIAATNRDLEKMVANREFRSDLYYRLNVFPIRIPPLRERREDIPLLVSYFVQKFAKEMQKKIGTIPTATMKGLAAWEWPGNIRELENFIERAVILTRGESLEAPLSELRKPSTDTAPATAVQPAQEDIARIVKETINAALNGKRATDEYAQKQREEIVRALTECNGRVGGADGAAARMGINRTTLISRMKKLGIDPRQYAS